MEKLLAPQECNSCLKCRNSIPIDEDFCNTCGLEIFPKCINESCKNRMIAYTLFCGKCGQNQKDFFAKHKNIFFFLGKVFCVILLIILTI